MDAQESFNGGVQVLVTGQLTGMDNTIHNFTQTFFLAPQDKGYFVLNDIFRFLDNVNANPVLVNDVVAPFTPEQSNQVFLVFGVLVQCTVDLALNILLSSIVGRSCASGPGESRF